MTFRSAADVIEGDAVEIAQESGHDITGPGIRFLTPAVESVVDITKVRCQQYFKLI